jgi:hypothetical protein
MDSQAIAVELDCTKAGCSDLSEKRGYIESGTCRFLPSTAQRKVTETS